MLRFGASQYTIIIIKSKISIFFMISYGEIFPHKEYLDGNSIQKYRWNLSPILLYDHNFFCTIVLKRILRIKRRLSALIVTSNINHSKFNIHIHNLTFIIAPTDLHMSHFFCTYPSPIMQQPSTIREGCASFATTTLPSNKYP